MYGLFALPSPPDIRLQDKRDTEKHGSNVANPIDDLVQVTRTRDPFQPKGYKDHSSKQAEVTRT